MAFLELKYDAFGLDINDSSIKIIKLSKNGANFAVDSYNKIKINPGIVEAGIIKDEKALSEAIKSARKTAKGKRITTKYVVASLPEEESFLQVIQMPKMSQKELKSAVIFQAENYIPLPISEVYMDFKVIVPIKDSLDHTDVLVVATPKKVVDPYVSCIKSAGLIPIAMEVEAQSVLTAVIKNETTEFPAAIIDIGENTTDFIVFCGRSIRFTYSIPISSGQLTLAIAQDLKISPEKAEEIKIKYGIANSDKKMPAESLKAADSQMKLLNNLVNQVKKYIDFYQDHASHEHLFTPSGIKKIILCGGGATLKGLPEFLSKELSLPAEIGDPFANTPLEKKSKINPADFLVFTTALGLAGRGINIKCEDLDD